MAATSTSSGLSRASDEAAKREDAVKAINEKLRLEIASLLKTLDLERSGVRALKAQYEADVRRLKSDARKSERNLENQLRSRKNADKQPPPDPGLKKLTAELLSLKATNKVLQESLELARQGARESAEQLRAHAADNAARRLELDKQARTHTHRLLEEIKSKDRIIAQLKKLSMRHSLDEKIERMECGGRELRKFNLNQVKVKHGVEDSEGESRREEDTHYKECFDMDSAVSSAPPSLSPQPHGFSDMWGCPQCRASTERAEERARECARLADALRDAREQLELLEFRVLELEDAAPDKCARETLTDSDSGFMSPSMQDSPVLRRTDSGYKSPAPSPPPNRKTLTHEGLSKQLRGMLGRCSAEDRDCLQQVLGFLRDLQALSSPLDIQIQTKKLCDIKTLSKLESELSAKSKVIATVSPYSQTPRSNSSLESLCDEPRKISILQESGIFDEVETDERSTQTEVFETLECGDLNTEIQRLNSIREKLEKRGVSRGPKEEGLECGCVKLGKRHKQYYERRLKFLEGKISIYEAAQDVKKAKLAERLQHEFVLENRVQDLEAQLACLQEKYEQLEEDCCELEELENDTRLHAQQLETDYEFVTAQLRDMSEQRECSRAQAERLARELEQRERTLGQRANALASTLAQLESAVPAIIVFNVLRALGNSVDTKGQLVVSHKLGTLNQERALVSRIRQQRTIQKPCNAIITWKNIEDADGTIALQKKIKELSEEKARIESDAARQRASFEEQIAELRARLQAEAGAMQSEHDHVDTELRKLETHLAEKQSQKRDLADDALCARIAQLMESERALSVRVRELERRETAYLDMLTQADDMWAEMESGYKCKIQQADCQMSELQRERDRLQANCSTARRQVIDLEQSESALRVSLEKSERDVARERTKREVLQAKLSAVEADLTASQYSVKKLADKHKSEIESFRQKTAQLAQQLECEKEASRRTESKLGSDLDKTRKELARTCKNVQDLEVTTAELKEEVESLETQLTLMQKGIAQCRRKCDDKVKTISRELSVKTEELEELRSDVMRQSLRPSLRAEMQDCNEYSNRYDYPIHHSLSYETRCSCPATRSRLVGSLIEDLFERIHSVKDQDLVDLCNYLATIDDDGVTKAKVTEYLLMAISKELVRSIGDADAKADTEEWRSGGVSCLGGVEGAGVGEGNAGVLTGASRLASVACACAAARLCAARPDLTQIVNKCQQEVLENSDVKIMEEQLASAIESILNCPSCALGTNAIVWSTDV